MPVATRMTGSPTRVPYDLYRRMIQDIGHAVSERSTVAVAAIRHPVPAVTSDAAVSQEHLSKTEVLSHLLAQSVSLALMVTLFFRLAA